MSNSKSYRDDVKLSQLRSNCTKLTCAGAASLLFLVACSEPDEGPTPHEKAQSAMAIHLIGKWTCEPVAQLPEVPNPWIFEFKPSRWVEITRRSTEKLQDGRSADITTLSSGPYQPYVESFSYTVANVKVVSASFDGDSNEVVQWAPTPELLEELKSTQYSFRILSTSQDEMLLQETVAINRDLAEWQCQRIQGTPE
jgi:hypothetical protein